MTLSIFYDVYFLNCTLYNSKINIKQHIIKDDVLLMSLIFELYKVQFKNEH